MTGDVALIAGICLMGGPFCPGSSYGRFLSTSQRSRSRAPPTGLAMIEEKARNMGRAKNGWQYGPVADAYFGTDYLYRAAAGWQSMYVNTPAEAYYPAVYTDAGGETLDGLKANYILHFDKDEFPPVNAFWSTTIYDLKTRLMVANDLKRYSIGDRTPGLKTNEDGSLDLYIQHESPGKDKGSNWLPAPNGPRMIWQSAETPQVSLTLRPVSPMARVSPMTPDVPI